MKPVFQTGHRVYQIDHLERGQGANSYASPGEDFLPPPRPGKPYRHEKPILIFYFEGGGGQKNTVELEGEPWFVAADVCRALGLGNSSQATARLDDDEKMTTLISNEGAASGKSSMTFVNEPGLYTLVLSSRKPKAKAFKRWITHEVIDVLRRDVRLCSKIASAYPLIKRAVMKSRLQEEQWLRCAPISGGDGGLFTQNKTAGLSGGFSLRLEGDDGEGFTKRGKNAQNSVDLRIRCAFFHSGNNRLFYAA